MTLRALVFFVAAAVLLAGATIGIERQTEALHPSAEMGMGFEVAAAGWPLVWAVDDPGASTVGVVDLADLLWRPDHILVLPFVLDAAQALAVLLGVAGGLRRRAGCGGRARHEAGGITV